jgi:hypothetical protein
MTIVKKRYAYIVSNSEQQLWLFHHLEAANRFAANMGEGARLRGDFLTYDVLKVPYSDTARSEAGREQQVPDRARAGF